MTLSAHRHWSAKELIVVVNEDVPSADGNVVYRFNSTHNLGWRTKGHAGPKPSLKDIKAAIARV